MKTRTNSPGFIYIIEYIGSHPGLKGKKYAGCSTWKKNWESYYGSPSKKRCKVVKLWKELTKIEPQNFKRTIVKELTQSENLIEEEIKLLQSVSPNIQRDPIWLNNCIPRKNGFPIYNPTEKEKKQIQKKREQTNMEKYGIPYHVIDRDKSRKACISRYGVDHHNKTVKNKQKVSQHRKEYFASLTPEQRKEHGRRVMEGKDPKRVIEGIEKGKQTKANRSQEYKNQLEANRYKKWCDKYYNRSEQEKQHTSDRCRAAGNRRLQYYLTIKYNDTGEEFSDFLKNLPKHGFALDGIKQRMKTDITKPLYSRTVKRWITILAVTKRPDLPTP